MKRRDILKVLAPAAASAVVTSPAIAQSDPEIRWRLASAIPPQQDIFYKAVRTVAAITDQLTDGKFKIQIFGPGEIVPALASFDAVQNGTVEMAYTASYFSLGKDPTFALGSSLPFGPNARLQRAWFHAGGLELLNEFFAKQGVIMFPGGNSGAQMAGWFRKEINSKSDLAGLKMRVGGLGGMILAKLGVVPQQLATGDVYAALERGTIDAVEVTGPVDDERFGFSKVAPFYYFPSFAEGNVEMSFFTVLSKWQDLPKRYQAALKAACAQAADEVLWRYDAEQTPALRRLLGQGVQLRQFPADIAEAARPIAAALYQELSTKSRDFQKIYEHYSAFTQSAYQWWQLAEFGYDAMMIQSSRQK